MSKILELIKKHFPEDSFTANDFSIATGMDTKVAAMGLTRLSNTYRIGKFITTNECPMYFYWTPEDCNKKRTKVNGDIKKYDLKQKPFKLLETKQD